MNHLVVKAMNLVPYGLRLEFLPLSECYVVTLCVLVCVTNVCVLLHAGGGSGEEEE